MFERIPTFPVSFLHNPGCLFNPKNWKKCPKTRENGGPYNRENGASNMMTRKVSHHLAKYSIAVLSYMFFNWINNFAEISFFYCKPWIIKIFSTNNMSYLTDSYIVFTLKMKICIQKYHFWPKTDGEKWSRKNIFQIPPFRRLLSLTS